MNEKELNYKLGYDQAIIDIMNNISKDKVNQ